MRTRFALTALAVLLFISIGCEEEETTTGPTTTSSGGQGGTTATGGTGGQGGAGAQAGTGGVGGSGGQGGTGGAANVCKVEGGICAGAAAECTDGNGTLAPNGDPGCVFDDGPGACCLPPVAAGSGDTCESHGGVCAPIAGCNFVDGAFAPATDCMGANRVCCVPETVCGPEDQICCAPGPAADFRPACDRGTWDCSMFSGTTLTPIEDCN